MAKDKKIEISLEEKLEKALVPIDEQPYRLPNSWVWTKLGEVYSLFTGNSIPENEKNTKYTNLLDGYKYIATKDVAYNGEINYENGIVIPYNEKKFRIAKANSTLLCIEGGSAGRKVGIIDRDVCFVNKLCCFESNFNFESKIIYYYIKSENFLSLFRKNMNGLIGGVSLSNLKKIEFPLPPLNEQKRIVEKLDFLLDKTKRAKEIIEEIKIDIENRKISILDRAFKGVLSSKWRNENKTSDVKELLKTINDEKIKKWEEECLQAEKEGKKKPKKPTITEIEDMIVPADEQPYKLPDSWVWVRLGEMADINPAKIKIDIAENELIDFVPMKNVSENSSEIIEQSFEKFKNLQKGYTQFIEGDILFAKITPCMENGKTAIISNLKKGIGYGSTEFHILRSSKITNNKILYNFLKQKRFREEAKYNMTGSVGFRRVPTDFMKNYPFPLPPLEEQQEIVRILDEVLKNENKVKELLELEEKIDILEKSILHKAFKGELGTQNSDDEFALELLKGIL